MKKILIIIVIIILVVLVIFVNKKSKMKEDTNIIPASNSSVNVSVEQSVTARETVSISVNGGSFYFKPNIIKVKQGDTVNVNFINDDGMHDFRIDEYSVATKILKTGEQETFSFVADKKGSFEYYCSVGNHRQMGMKGTLIVE